jgi:LysR family malonate utilization transcriptional regulator
MKAAHTPPRRRGEQLIPLQPRYLMRQTIALNFLRTRERDPNLLALLSVCRLAKAELG